MRECASVLSEIESTTNKTIQIYNILNLKYLKPFLKKKVYIE